MATLERPQAPAAVHGVDEPRQADVAALRAGVPSAPPAELTRTTPRIDFSPRTRWAAARGEQAGAPAEQLRRAGDDDDEAAREDGWAAGDDTAAPSLLQQTLSPPDSTDAAAAAAFDQTVGSLQSAQSAFLEILLSLISPPPLIDLHDDPASAQARSAEPPGSTADEQPDAFAAAIQAVARSHPAAAETARRRRLAAASSSSGDNAASEGTLADLLAVVDIVATTLPSRTDAELSRTLGSLLECFDRLLHLVSSQPRTPSLASQISSPATPRLAASTGRMERSASAPGNESLKDWGGVGFYEAIQKEAKALQAADGWEAGTIGRGGRDRSESLSARRQLHSAEAEYLWGKVDDLLDAVGDLCRERMEQGMQEHDAAEAEPRASTSSADPFVDVSPPSVSHSTRISTDLRDPSLPLYSPGSFGATPNLPHYRDSLDAKSILSSTTTDDRPHTVLSRQSMQHIREASMPTAQNEKMQRELDNVTSAIERLYRTAPQLANQRASLVSPPVSRSRSVDASPRLTQRIDPAKRKELRERQLDAVLVAIERLASRGRLESQRAAVPQGVAQGIIGMGWEGTRNERLRIEKEADLRRMLDRIDRAAGRRLDQQRSERRKPASLRSGIEGGTRPKMPDLGRSRSYTGLTTRESEGGATERLRTLGLSDFLSTNDAENGGDSAAAAQDAQLLEVRSRSPRALSMPATSQPLAATAPPSQREGLRKKMSLALLSRPGDPTSSADGTANGREPKSPMRSGFLSKLSSGSSKRDSTCGRASGEGSGASLPTTPRSGTFPVSDGQGPLGC